MPPGNPVSAPAHRDRGARVGLAVPRLASGLPASGAQAIRRAHHARPRDYVTGRRRAGARRTTRRPSTGRSRSLVADLKALTIFWEDRRVISAGVPWYASPFGRDALITGFQALLVIRTSRATLSCSSPRTRAGKVDDFREEEPVEDPA